MRLYHEHFTRGWAPLHERARLIDVPTAYAIGAKELAMMPRSWAQRMTNLKRWTLLPSGGHFLPMESPLVLVDEYRKFFAEIR